MASSRRPASTVRPLTVVIAAIFAAVLPISASHAQNADTLDWRRYYPLEVGNVWEYHDAEIEDSFVRVTLVSASSVGEWTYFRRRTDTAIRTYAPGGADTLRSTTFDIVRYGDGGVVSAPSVEADTVALATCDAEDGFARDLRAAFGMRSACPDAAVPGADSVWVEGTYATRWAPAGVGGQGPFDPVEVAAIKQFTVGAIFSTFVADVGPVATGNLWGPRLHYARIGGVEYGEPSVLVSTDRQPEGDRLAVRTLGNPVRREARFSVGGRVAHGGRWTVTDALGRTVETAPLARSPRGALVRVSTAGLTPGPYRFTLHADGSRASVAFTVVR